MAVDNPSAHNHTVMACTCHKHIDHELDTRAIDVQALSIYDVWQATILKPDVLNVPTVTNKYHRP